MRRACCALPLLLLCLAPPSWADQDQVQGSWPWSGLVWPWSGSMKRSDPIEDATFFAVRGKKGGEDFAMKPNSLFSALASKRFGSLKPNSLFSAFPGKRSLKPNSLFGAIPGLKAAQGKRFMKPNSLFGAIPLKRESEYWPLLGKRSMKPNSLFGAIHGKRLRVGKRSLKPNGLFGVRVQRAMKPNGFFSVAKRDYQPWNPSPGAVHMMWPGLLGWGLSGNLYNELYNEMEDENDDEQDDLEDSADTTDAHEEVGQDFWKQFGLRKPDKKEAATEFWATRGKRDFWASRGKRGDNLELEVDDLNQATAN